MTVGPLTGGCQCGAVRFRVVGEASHAGVCHCRMCQKAFGGFYAPLVEVNGLTWTRGEPTYFRSSSIARRGFCAACGTPLTYEPDSGRTEVAIGAFDEPARIKPTIQVGLESRIPWLGELDALPTRPAPNDEAAAMAGLRNFQHPDHDT
jgi:hypothetical protein